MGIFQERIFPISYAKTVKDPVAAVKEIYANFGWEVTPPMIENMQSHLQENQNTVFTLVSLTIKTNLECG